MEDHAPAVVVLGHQRDQPVAIQADVEEGELADESPNSSLPPTFQSLRYRRRISICRDADVVR